MGTNATQAILNKAREDKFLLNLTLPASLLKINKKLPTHRGKISLDSLQFSVYGAVVPKIQINEIQLPQYGQVMKASSHRREPYEPLVVKFKVDNNFWNYWTIWTWLNLLNDQDTGEFDEAGLTPNMQPKGGKMPFERHTSNREQKLQEKYTTNMSLYGLDEYENKTIQFIYHGVFPTSLDGISYNYQTPDEIESSVSFSYSKVQASLL
ncbi:hypothetical protein H8E06_00640 [bacterium]|nr:hypothetical protein [bacterium]